MPSNFAIGRFFRARGAFFLAVVVFLASSATAQTGGTGALTGTVSDSSGAVVRDAKVTATSADTGQARTVTTGSDGGYTFNLLSPGNYRLRVRKSDGRLEFIAYDAVGAEHVFGDWPVRP